jgi:hypothetical protein
MVPRLSQEYPEQVLRGVREGQTVGYNLNARPTSFPRSRTQLVLQERLGVSGAQSLRGPSAGDLVKPNLAARRPTPSG